MIVFITGGSGFIGTRIIKKLVERGHQVIALARSEKSAKTVRDLGAEPLKGDVTDLESLKRGAARADAVIHTAFNHSSFAPEKYTVSSLFFRSVNFHQNKR